MEKLSKWLQLGRSLNVGGKEIMKLWNTDEIDTRKLRDGGDEKGESMYHKSAKIVLFSRSSVHKLLRVTIPRRRCVCVCECESSLWVNC